MRTRLRFKQQMSDVDCGPACLAMILDSYDYSCTVYEIRELCEKFGSALSTKSIIGAARDLGLKADLFAADMESLSDISLPCILYWGFNHFVVLKKIHGDKYTILDPSFGITNLGKSEFRKKFTGIGIQLTPTAKLAQRSAPRNTRFFDHLRTSLDAASAKTRLSVLSFIALLLQLFSLIAPLLTVYLFDVIVPAQLNDALPVVGIVIFLLSLNFWISSYLRSRAIVGLQFVVDKALLDGFFRHMLKLPNSFFIERSVGDIQSRMNSNTVVRDALSTYTVSAVIDSVFVISYFGVLFFVSPLFATVTIVLGIVQSVIYIVSVRGIRNYFASEIRSRAAYQSAVVDTIKGIHIIKGTSAEEEVLRQWGRRLDSYLLRARDRSLVDAKISSLNTALKLATPSFLLWVGVWLYFSESMSLGTLLAANSIGLMALTPLNSLTVLARQYQNLVSHIERIGEIWTHKEEDQGTEDVPTLGSGKKLEIIDMSFRYKTSSVDAINKVDLEIPFGKKIGIFGSSGSGKSTLVSLILGINTPDSGQIFIAGVDLQTILRNQYRRIVGYVAQDPYLFDSSVRKNIALLEPGAPMNKVVEAARMANIHNEILKMPMEYESRIGEGGVTLSGGQQQRLAIARVLVKQPKILVLDEATSSLDTVNESIITKNLMSLSCTQIVVSHRIGTIKNCDRIYLMDNGRVTQSGDHDSLLSESEYYRKCAESQETIA